MVDFPNIAPPFEACWLDFKAPQQINSREFGVQPWREPAPSHWGFLVLGTKLDTEQERQDFLKFAHPYWKQVFLGQLPRAKWGMSLYIHWRQGGQNFGPLWQWLTLVDDQGHMLKIPDGRYVVSALCVDPLMQEANDDLAVKMGEDEARDAAYHSIAPYMHTAMLSLSFMHCKNVVLQDVVPPRTVIHNKAQKRRGQTPYQPVPYKVLQIQPMKQVIKQTERAHGVGTAKALHIVRGNFADYQEGRGLFGKYHGTYWRPQHVRGTTEKGVATKDYSIKI